MVLRSVKPPLVSPLSHTHTPPTAYSTSHLAVPQAFQSQCAWNRKFSSYPPQNLPVSFQTFLLLLRLSLSSQPPRHRTCVILDPLLTFTPHISWVNKSCHFYLRNISYIHPLLSIHDCNPWFRPSSPLSKTTAIAFNSLLTGLLNSHHSPISTLIHALLRR